MIEHCAKIKGATMPPDMEAGGHEAEHLAE